MQFCFYPTHEHDCSNVSHCPHVGGAAIGSLVMIANHSGTTIAELHCRLDAEREVNSRLVAENLRLEKALHQAKLELKLERQNKFATNEQKNAEVVAAADELLEPNPSEAKQPKKKGAPVGHPGWYRPTPTEYDWAIDVKAPKRCPHCNGVASVLQSIVAVEHLQEDILDNVYRVVCYRHEAAMCEDCGRHVQQPGKGEILGSRIGPELRSIAAWLRNVIGITYRKVPQVIAELYNVTFTPAALLGFEKMLAEKAEPIVEDIRKKLASSDGAVHADETYWTTDGARSYFWVHGNEKFIHFQYDTTRAGQVSRDILGDDFTGTLVTDCYSGYFASVAGAKQKCLAHVARKARDWQKLVEPDSIDFQYFADIRKFVSRACRFCRDRREGKSNRRKLRQEATWLRDELQRLLTCDVRHDKAIQLQALLIRHPGEWLVFLDDPRVSPTNNLAERALRPLVVLRKITFGSRTDTGATRMAKLMTVAETARRHGKRTRDIYYELYTRPPDRVLTNLYASR